MNTESIKSSNKQMINNLSENDINNKKAFELYKKAASSGNATGIYNLGFCYQYGIGTGINHQKAFELYQEVANLNDMDAIFMLGSCYHYGIGTYVDNQKAFEL